MCQGLLSCRRHIGKREDPGDEVEQDGRKLMADISSPGALSIYEKNPEISVVAKVEFPIGKKVVPFGRKPRYVARCPTVDLELVQTTRNVNGTRHSVGKFQPGKRDHLFRFSTFSGNFPVGRTDETCSIYRRTGNSGNFD